MTRARPLWSKEREEELQRLHAAPKTSGEIAKIMGVSRSTICAKLSRMNLRSEIGPTTTRRQRGRAIKEAAQKAIRKAATPKLVLVIPPPTDAKSLLDNEGCCYPVSGEGDETLYCGRPGRPYCPAHHQLCHNPPGSVRELQRSVRRYVA